MTGQTASMFNKPMVTINFAIIVMLAWTIGCYLIAMFVFNKKDILI